MRKTDLYISDKNIYFLFRNQISKITTILRPYVSTKAALSKAAFNIAFYAPDSKEFLYNTEEYNMCKYPEELNNMIINEGIEFRKKNSCKSFNQKTAEDLTIIKKLFEKLKIQGKDLTELTGDIKLKTEKLIKFEMHFKVFQKWLCENKKIKVYNDEENHIRFKSLDQELFDVERLETHDNLLITKKGLEFVQNYLFDIYLFFYCSNIFGRNCSHLRSGILFGKIRKKAIKEEDGRELDVFESGNYSYVLFPEKQSEEEAYLNGLKDDTEYFLITNDGKTNGSYEVTINKKTPNNDRLYVMINKLDVGDMPFMSMDYINAKSFPYEKVLLELEDEEYDDWRKPSPIFWGSKRWRWSDLEELYKENEDESLCKEEFIDAQDAAEAGDYSAMFYLADCFENGWGFEFNDETYRYERCSDDSRIRYLKRFWTNSAEETLLLEVSKGDEEAMYDLSTILYGDKWFPTRPEVSDGTWTRGMCLNYYLWKASLEEKDAVLTVAKCYERGFWTAENKEKAFEWYRRAAELGNVYAMKKMSETNYSDEWVLKAPKEFSSWTRDNIFEFFLQEAESGNKEYIIAVAKCYERGYWTKEDKSQAFKWYLRAAEMGDNESRIIVSKYCEKGIEETSEKNDSVISDEVPF